MHRWLLPEAIEDVLPDEAWHVETLRRTLLDEFRRHGYEYVIPPLMEYVLFRESPYFVRLPRRPVRGAGRSATSFPRRGVVPVAGSFVCLAGAFACFAEVVACFAGAFLLLGG